MNPLWRTASVSLAVALWASGASAEPTPRVDRTVTLSLSERTTLTYALQISPSELARVRAAGDQNHDGALGADEATRLLSSWTTAVRTGVSIATGRGRVGYLFPLDVKAFEVGHELDGLEGPVAVPEGAPGARVAWTFDLRLGGGDDRLDVEDKTAFLPFDRTRMSVKDSPQRRLVGLGLADDQLGTTPELSWTDQGRTVHVTWTPPPGRPWWMVPAVIAVGLLIAIATFWSVRKQ